MMKAKGWLTIKARRTGYADKVTSVSIPRVTVNKPDTSADEDAILIEIELPEDYFDEAAAPTISVTLPKPDIREKAIPVVVRPRVRSKAAQAIIGES